MTKTEVQYWIAGLLLADLLSFLGHYEPTVSQALFIIAVTAFLVVSLRNLELALLITLAEIFVGSKGYLFLFTYNDITISFRLAAFIILFLVSLKQIKNLDKEAILKLVGWAKPILALGFIVFLSFIRGLAHGYGFWQVFFDANAYFFLGLLLPLFIVTKKKEFLERVAYLLFYSAVYLSVKTLLLLYFFTHQFEFFLPDLYQWVRHSGVGEITWTTTGAWRIFIQSQIFVLVAWWVVASKSEPDYSILISPKIIFILSIFMSALLISFSRSFWFGLILSMGAVGFWKLYNRQFKELAMLTMASIISFVLGIVIIIGVMKIPLPAASTDGTLNLSERLQIEEAASSRWNLLTPLWSAVKKNMIWGAGFGAAVTYTSNDPRVRSLSPDGRYTTTAFEWGYLDIWLKIGLLGLAVYVWIIWKIFSAASQTLNLNSSLAGLLTGLLAVAAVHVASPYLNHPLGLGLVLLLYTLTVSRPDFKRFYG